MTPEMEMLVRKAKEGDKEALESLVRKIQDRVYGLSLRMMGYPSDAEDAAQEILVKIIAHLGSFRGESNFTTWVYRIAANHLLTTRKRRAELMEMTFEQCEAHIERGIGNQGGGSVSGPEQALLVEEIKLTCLQGVLLCLDRPLRLVFALGEVFGVTSR